MIKVSRVRLNATNKFRSLVGATLIELVMVIVVLAVLSVSVLTDIDDRRKHSAIVQADEFHRVLSKAQLLAISQGKRLKLVVVSTGYSICLATAATCDTANAIIDPVSGEALSVSLLDDNVRFVGSSAGTYYFDTLGRPVTAATGTALETAAKEFRLNNVGLATDVVVRRYPVTGFTRVDG